MPPTIDAGPETPPDVRLMACFCTREHDDSILAVVAFTPALARSILAAREKVLTDRVQTPSLDWMEFSSGDCRFFDEAFTDDAEGVGLLFDAVRDAAAGEEDADSEEGAADEDGWFLLPPDTPIPDAGDYRTAYEHLRVGEHYICWCAAGKHADEEFETADVPLMLLRELAGESVVDAPDSPAVDRGPQTREESLQALRIFDQQADALRQELGLHRRDECLSWYSDASGEREVEVLADGYGKFIVRVTEGRNPNDQLELDRREFDNEAAALAAASTLAGEDEDEAEGNEEEGAEPAGGYEVLLHLPWLDGLTEVVAAIEETVRAATGLSPAGSLAFPEVSEGWDVHWIAADESQARAIDAALTALDPFYQTVWAGRT